MIGNVHYFAFDWQPVNVDKANVTLANVNYLNLTVQKLPFRIHFLLRYFRRADSHSVSWLSINNAIFNIQNTVFNKTAIDKYKCEFRPRSMFWIIFYSFKMRLKMFLLLFKRVLRVFRSLRVIRLICCFQVFISVSLLF